MVECEDDFSAFDIVRREYIHQEDQIHLARQEGGEKKEISPQLKDVFHVITHTNVPNPENWDNETNNQRLLATYYSNLKEYYMRCGKDRTSEEYAGLIEWLQNKISSIDEEMDVLPASFSNEELIDLC